MAKNIQIQQIKGKYAQACAFMMKIQIFIKYTKIMLKNIILGWKPYTGCLKNAALKL
jgi:hypothetical protein